MATDTVTNVVKPSTVRSGAIASIRGSSAGANRSRASIHSGDVTTPSAPPAIARTRALDQADPRQIDAAPPRAPAAAEAPGPAPPPA